MLPFKKQTLSGWGNYPRRECRVYRPEKVRDLSELMLDADKPLIGRGQGKSYGDAALQPTGTILTERLNHFLSFDVANGLLCCQAGVTLDEVLSVVVPKGWFLPVIPGTKFVSMGGCFASNVHGKNHYCQGEFAEHVTEIQLILPSGEKLICSPENNSELFWASAGGMGLTGIIENITIQLIPIQSVSLQAVKHRVNNIEAMLNAFDSGKAQYDYMMGWIDHFATGEKLGQGIFEGALHLDPKNTLCTPIPSSYQSEQGISIPPWIPGWVLNKWSMSLYNKRHFKKVRKTQQSEVVDFEGFFHPLDSLQHWNRLYGKKGFLQYQCLIPESDTVLSDISTLLESIQASNLTPFLGVIKLHRPSQGMLTFSKAGYSLALDFPNNDKVYTLLDKLDQLLLKMGGRVYLAKDARLKPENFAMMYQDNLTAWRTTIKQVNEQAGCHSLLAQRLNLMGQQ